MFNVRPLPVATQILDEESINSWLLRASVNQGCDLSTILFYHWSKYNLRHHDFDKGFNHIDKQIHQDMAILAKTNVETFDNKSLIKFNYDIGINYQPNRSLTWVLPIPKFNAKTMVGHQYCPQCMQDDKSAYLKLKWRFSWTVYCEQHLILLQDTCYNCGLPYQPHLIKAHHQFINRCPHCREKLHLISSNQLLCMDALEFQSIAEQVLLTSQATAFRHSINFGDWFELMLFFINLIRKSTLEKGLIYKKLINTLGIRVEGFELKKIKTGLKFDYLSRAERVILMAYANQMHKITSDNWLSACEKNDLTQNSFRLGKRPVIPKAFSSIYKELPSVVKPQSQVEKTYAKPKSAKAVNTSWERMQLRIEKLRIYDQAKPNKRARRLIKS